MKRSKKCFRTRLGFEQLENRKLLAADLMAGAAMEVETFEADNVPCMVASADFPSEASDAIDVGSEIEPEAVDPRNLDLADGMDGFFGAISPDNPTETLQFTAAEDGMVDIVVASSFGESQTQISVSDSNGMVVDSSVEGLEGFGLLTFEASEGETYEVIVSSDDAEMEGQFQLTVGFEKFVDQHANATGEESTELVFTDNQTELAGRLEGSGDTDTFRFTANESGEMILGLNETVDDSRVGLNIEVSDAEGNGIAKGSTNETLQISFDVESGSEYFVSVSSDNGEKGTYEFNLELDPTQPIDPTEPVETVDTADVNDENVDTELISDSENGDDIVDSELVDETEEVAELVEDEVDEYDNEGTQETEQDVAVIECEVASDAETGTEVETDSEPLVQAEEESEESAVNSEEFVEIVADEAIEFENDTPIEVEIINEVTDESEPTETETEVVADEAESDPVVVDEIDDVETEVAAETNSGLETAPEEECVLVPETGTVAEDEETTAIANVVPEVDPIQETIDDIVDFVETEIDNGLDALDDLFSQLGDDVDDLQESLTSGPFGFFPNFRGFGFFRI